MVRFWLGSFRPFAEWRSLLFGLCVCAGENGCVCVCVCGGTNFGFHAKTSSYFHVRSQQGASALPGGHWPTKTSPGRGENVPTVGNVCDILNHTSRALVYLANSRCILVLLDELMDSRVRVRTQVSGSR